MKRQKIFIVLVTLFTMNVTLFALEVMTFNIQKGGKKTRTEILEILKKSKAEIISINEAYDEDTFKMLAQDMGYYSYRSTTKKYQVGILSKFPLTETKTLTDHELSRAVIKVKVKLTEKKHLNIFVVHLKPLGLPSRRKKRKAEIAVILKQVEKINPKEPILLMGDFNEHSHLDKPHKKTNVSRAIMLKGFIDCFRTIHPSVANNPGNTQSAKILLIKRIDFIYINQALSVSDSKTISKGFYKPWPSDHAAVLATIQFK